MPSATMWSTSLIIGRSDALLAADGVEEEHFSVFHAEGRIAKLLGWAVDLSDFRRRDRQVRTFVGRPRGQHFFIAGGLPLGPIARRLAVMSAPHASAQSRSSRAAEMRMETMILHFPCSWNTRIGA